MAKFEVIRNVGNVEINFKVRVVFEVRGCILFKVEAEPLDKWLFQKWY
jgi:hypothetical protein